MNKLIIAAVAATMTSVAMADISISGSAKVNNLNGHATDDGTSMEADLKVSGKSGDTGVVAMISLDGTFEVEQLYATTSIAGVGVKAGTWKGGKSELTQATGNNAHRYNVSTSFGGVKLAFEDKDGSDSATTISGTIGGVSVSHKAQGDSSETKAAGSIGGIAAKIHQKDNGTATNTSVTLSTAVQGINLTYVDVKADQADGTVMDGFFGKHADVNTANGFGISTDVAGNKVTFKTMDMAIDGAAEVNTKKVIVTRALASGATFEAVYANKEGSDSTLDLELAVKF
jgi:hypothetical protein